MPKRSTRVTLSNNTPFQLTLLDSRIASNDPCHGSWTDGWRPTSQIAPRSRGAWQSESSGIGTGTEGWVKYLIGSGAPCPEELIYIHWDNPFVWVGSTNPIDFSVGTSDITPPCNSDIGVRGFPGTQVSPPGCRHELFGAGASGGGLQGVTWWDALMNWPALLAFTILGDADVNLEFVIGLRLAGSVDQTIFSFYDGTQGLRSLVRASKQASLRALFRM
jgi:hypothetical protein